MAEVERFILANRSTEGYLSDGKFMSSSDAFAALETLPSKPEFAEIRATREISRFDIGIGLPVRYEPRVGVYIPSTPRVRLIQDSLLERNNNILEVVNRDIRVNALQFSAKQNENPAEGLSAFLEELLKFPDFSLSFAFLGFYSSGRFQRRTRSRRYPRLSIVNYANSRLSLSINDKVKEEDRHAFVEWFLRFPAEPSF